MTQSASGLDHARIDVWPENPPVLSSSGNSRPLLVVPRPVFVVHHTGAGRRIDLGDTPEEIRQIQDYAKGAGKPWEYNSVSDSHSETWEYAGDYRAAHNGSGYPGDNNDWGHLTLYNGVYRPEAPVIDKLISGILRARASLIQSGRLTPDHKVVGHTDVRPGGTFCPGVIYHDRDLWARVGGTINTTPPPITGDQAMYTLANPIRTSDTRNWPGVLLEPSKNHLFAAQIDQVPVNAKSLVITVTATQAVDRGFISVGKPGAAVSGSSCLNYQAGNATSNTTFVSCVDRSFTLRTSKHCHVIIDVVGYVE